jgi:hypothetical protein
MKNTNTTLAMVAVLAAVTMLSAVLAVPIQEASASNGRGGSDGGGGNSLEINQKQECERAGCDQDLTVTSTQTIED